jgi:hypothetical protein
MWRDADTLTRMSGLREAGSGMEERVSLLAGVSLTAYLLASFVFWRRGLAEYGMAETLSWVMAVLGTVLLLGYVFGAKPLLSLLMDADDGCLFGLVIIVSYAVVVLGGFGYWQTIRTGGAPEWILNPANILTLAWDDPPTWARVTSYVIAVLFAMLVTASNRPARRRRRRSGSA